MDQALMSVQIKSEADVAGMREAGRLAAELLDHLTPLITSGVTTKDIDRAAHDYMVNVQGTIPATLNYAPPGHSPYPASLCTSVNHVVCHGIPGEKKLKDGDHGDTSRMFFIGKPSIQARRLVEITYEAMWRGIRAVRPGAHLGDIGATIQKFAEGHGFSIVREFCGHGIGTQFHEEPQVLHYGRPGTGLKLLPGMTFTIEPMINAGRAAIRALADGWTIVTVDHSLSAQWEHTVLVTADGHEVLTVSAGTPEPSPPA